jgi:hypothetical protein
MPGLDDYPRAPVLDTVEAHVDLHAWLVVLTRRVAEVFALFLSLFSLTNEL